MAPLIGLQGLLQELPVPRLLVGLRGEKVTGLLELREISGLNNKIYVRTGLPVHVIGPDSLDRLDLMLVEAGLLSSADVARAQAVRESTGRLMGQVLCELGLVGPDQLAEVLRWQVGRKVTRLFSSEEGSFSISALDHPFALGTSSPGAPVDPRALVFPGILASYSENKLISELGPLTGRLVRLRQVSTTQLNELGFESRHSPLLMHLRLAGFRLHENWVHGSLGPRPRDAKSVLLALQYLDLLEVVGADAAAPSRPMPPLETGPVVIAGAAPSRPMSSSRSSSMMMAAAAPAQPMAPSRSGPMVMPAAAPSRPMSSSQSSSINIPAAAPTRPMSPSQSSSAIPIGRLTPTPQPALRPPMPTPPPQPALRSPMPTPPPQPVVRNATPLSSGNTQPRIMTPLPSLDPAQLYALAQRLFSNGDLARAEAAFEAVASADAGNQRVRAFLIWIHFWKSSEAQRNAALELTLRTLREVLKSESNFAIGHYFVGALSKLQKDMTRAEQAFKTALQHDPNLIEAQRELRLMTLRKTQR